MNLERARDLMARDGVDVLVAGTPVNFLYMSGFEDRRLFEFGMRAFAVVARDASLPSTLVLPPFELAALADRGTWVDEVRVGGRGRVERSEGADLGPAERELAAWIDATAEAAAPTPIAALRDVLAERTGPGSIIAGDDPGLAAEVGDLGADRPSWRDARSLFRLIRAVKTDAEVDRLREAARRNEEALLAAFAAAAPGVRWDTVVRAFGVESAKRGLAPGHLVGGAGQRASAHFVDGDYELRSGDVVRLDGGGNLRGYRADTGHTAVLDEPSDRILQLYGALRDGVEAASEMARPGVTAAALFERFVDAMQRGNPRATPPNVGHAIGLEQYDSVMIAPGEGYVLEPNFVFNLESPYYELGWGGVQLEHTFCVTSDGLEPLTTRDSELIRL